MLIVECRDATPSYACKRTTTWSKRKNDWLTAWITPLIQARAWDACSQMAKGCPVDSR